MPARCDGRSILVYTGSFGQSKSTESRPFSSQARTHGGARRHACSACRRTRLDKGFYLPWSTCPVWTEVLVKVTTHPHGLRLDRRRVYRREKKVVRRGAWPVGSVPGVGRVGRSIGRPIVAEVGPQTSEGTSSSPLLRVRSRLEGAGGRERGAHSWEYTARLNEGRTFIL